MRVGVYLLMGSGLGFIGLGIQPPLSELGALLASGKEYYQSAWWLFAFPTFFICFTVLTLNLFGEGLRDKYNHL
jgi:dipeptide transport system permease protein